MGDGDESKRKPKRTTMLQRVVQNDQSGQADNKEAVSPKDDWATSALKAAEASYVAHLEQLSESGQHLYFRRNQVDMVRTPDGEELILEEHPELLP